MHQDETFFSRAAQRGPFVIFNDQLYHIAGIDPKAADFLQAGNHRIALVPGLRVPDVEAIESRFWSQEIFDLKKGFIEEIVNEEMKSRYDQQNAGDLLLAQRFVLRDVLPLMIDTAKSRDELLGIDPGDRRSSAQVIEDIISQEIGAQDAGGKKIDEKQIREALQPYMNFNVEPIYGGRKVVDKSSVLWQLLGGRDVYVAQGKVFVLRNTPQDVSFNLGGKTVGLTAFEDLEGPAEVEDLEAEYCRVVRDLYKSQAANEFEEQIVAELKRRTDTTGLKELVAKKELRYGNLGVVREGSRFYVYWEYPAFAMRNPIRPEVYHPFPKTKIAVVVQASEGRVHHKQGAYVIDPMVHPTLRSWDSRYEHICNLSESSYENSAPEVVRQISDAINAFTNGLNMESIRRHGNRGEDSEFFGRPLKRSLTMVGELTREQALAKGYRITNDWHIGVKGT